MRALTLFALLLLPASLPAATYRLEADGSGDFSTIAAALAVATAGDVIELGCGTYYEHDLQLPDGITLRSEGGVASCATIDAQQQGRVMEGWPAALSGLTIQNGYHDEHLWESGGWGAGACLGGAVSIDNCDFLDNHAVSFYHQESHGGGLYQYGGRATLLACRFAGNIALNASGALFDRSAELMLCRFEGDNLLISGESPPSQSVLNGCELLQADAILNDASLRILNSVIENGSLLVAVYSDAGLELASCTIHASYVFWEGGLTLWMHQCLMTEGTFVGYSGLPVTVGRMACNDFHGTEVDPSLADWLGQQGNFSADPLFCDASGGDYRLHANSPCAPAGNDCGALIGALPVGCGATALESRSWGSIKALY